MAPLRIRQSMSKDKFSSYFGTQRTIAYNDPSSRGAGSGVRSIAWNPLGSLIATGGDRTLRVWNPDRQNVKYSTELKGHTAPIEKVAFNPVKDAELCSVSSDGVVKFWDVRTKAVINEIKGLGDAFTLAWSPDGESLIVGSKSDNLFVLSPTQSTPISSHQQSIQTNQITFCHSGKKIFLTTGDGRIKIFSYPEFEPMFYSKSDPTNPFTLDGHTSSCMSIDMQPTARFLATGGSDSIIALWDTTNWICQRTLIDMTGPVRSISFSFDGSFIVGGSEEGSGLEIAHTETGEYVHSIKTAGACPVVAWHPSRYWLAYTDVGGLRIIGVDPDRK
ncbi:probable THO complex subunit 3 [Rhynchosporium agropyri]|uniref:Probable THO complex subunit 3 n=2 Tax=Rhynchosporium TaxID=38037 RepID=A0A1E1MGQ4_RHYSE|nr:probable THO complex subunit 3 [Rhynchosporium agropyri]CZT48266.1 probable THO complex subunit 3 [Rhynchosporium secalis]